MKKTSKNKTEPGNGSFFKETSGWWPRAKLGSQWSSLTRVWSRLLGPLSTPPPRGPLFPLFLLLLPHFSYTFEVVVVVKSIIFISIKPDVECKFWIKICFFLYHVVSRLCLNLSVKKVQKYSKDPSFAEWRIDWIQRHQSESTKLFTSVTRWPDYFLKFGYL